MLSRVLLISTSRECAPQPTVPIGAAWVAEALHLAGFTVRLLDLCFAKDPLTAIGDAIVSFKPDGIGISVRNLDNCDFLHPKSFLPDVKQLTDFVKTRTDAPILLGGAGVSIMPSLILDYLELDYAVVGEGEQAAVLFFAGAGSPADPAPIPGVVRRGVPEQCPAGQPQTPPSAGVVPRMHHWIDTRRYLNYEPVLPVQGKRGCANGCLYCTYNRIEGRTWRLRKAASVVDEISLAMRQTGAREFEFVDSIFNQPEGYLETLLEEILRRDLKAKLRVSSLSPKGLSKGQVRLMERAGMTSLVITPESASDVMLAALGKDFTADDIHRAAELFAGSSIKALWCFLLGGPQEDETTLARTIEFVNRLGSKDGAFITTGIRIYPSTGLHELAIAEGIVAADDNLLMPLFYFSPKITTRRALAMLQSGLAHPSRCIHLTDTRSSTLRPLRRLGTLLGLPSPFWRYAGYLNWLTGGRGKMNR